MTLMKQEEILERFGRYCRFHGMFPGAFIENLLPVYVGVRDVESVFMLGFSRSISTAGGVSLELQGLLFERFRESARNEFGIESRILQHTIGSPGRGSLNQKVFLYRDAAVDERLDELQAINDEISTLPGMSKRYYDLLNDFFVLEAEIVGLPECCANLFSEERAASSRVYGMGRVSLAKLLQMMKEMPEYRAAAQLNEEAGILQDLDSFRKLDEDLFLAYFGYDRYPCQPRCPNAQAIGEQRIEGLEQAGLPIFAQMYKEVVLPHNAFVVYCSPYMEKGPDDIFAFMRFQAAIQAHGRLVGRFMNEELERRVGEYLG